MTCREKLAIDHPEQVGEEFMGGANNCPHTYGYREQPDYCHKLTGCCELCWDREMPAEIPIEKPKKEPETFHDKLVQSIKDVGQEIIKNAEDYAGRSLYLSRLTITIDFNPEYAGVGGMLNPEIDVDKTYLCGTIIDRMRGECNL